MENLGYFEQPWMKTFIFFDVHYNVEYWLISGLHIYYFLSLG